MLTVGQFKDDQTQSHVHNVGIGGTGLSFTSSGNPEWGPQPTYFSVAFQTQTYGLNMKADSILSGRSGDVTRGKTKGVKYIIKVL